MQQFDPVSCVLYSLRPFGLCIGRIPLRTLFFLVFVVWWISLPPRNSTWTALFFFVRFVSRMMITAHCLSTDIEVTPCVANWICTRAHTHTNAHHNEPLNQDRASVCEVHPCIRGSSGLWFMTGASPLSCLMAGASPLSCFMTGASWITLFQWSEYSS